MKSKYQSGLDYFTKSLAMDANVTISPDNDVFRPFDDKFCYLAVMKELSITLPSGSSFNVYLILRSRALPQGVSIEVRIIIRN